MKINNTASMWMVILLMLIGYCGCSDINSLHEQYLQLGETKHTGMVDSVKIFPGRNRVIISYRYFDPKVAKLKVYWDFRQKSAIFDVPSDKLGQDIEVAIDALDKPQYNFELVTSNRDETIKSMPLNISSKVYGSIYESALNNRKITSSIIFPSTNHIKIDWAKALEGMVAVEVSYRNSSDEEIVLKIPSVEMVTRINDIGNEVEITYRTLHIPEKNCVDTFFTEFTAMNVVPAAEKKLNRFLFSRWNPPGIPYNETHGYPIELLWNGNTAEYGYITSNSAGPMSITLDLGQNFQLSRIKVYQNLDYFDWYNMEKFQLWGSPHPDVTDDFDKWIFLGEFTSEKPSGLPLGQMTQEDVAYAAAGEDYVIQKNGDMDIRYIRIHILKRYREQVSPFSCGELEFYGYSGK